MTRAHRVWPVHDSVHDPSETQHPPPSPRRKQGIVCIFFWLACFFFSFSVLVALFVPSPRPFPCLTRLMRIVLCHLALGWGAGLESHKLTLFLSLSLSQIVFLHTYTHTSFILICNLSHIHSLISVTTARSFSPHPSLLNLLPPSKPPHPSL